MLDSKGEGGQLGIPWGPKRIYKYIFSSELAGPLLSPPHLTATASPPQIEIGKIYIFITRIIHYRIVNDGVKNIILLQLEFEIRF